MTSTRGKSLLFVFIIFIFGLLIKVPMLFTDAVFDTIHFIMWGTNVFEKGLAEGYHGVYFPIQFQILGLVCWAANFFNIEALVVLKLSNLIFDIATFWLLILIFLQLKVQLTPIWIYWLNPYFLAEFSLGYLDFHFAFFVLLVIYMLNRGESFKNYLWAGLPLAVAFTIKPQAQSLILVVAIYSAIKYYKTKNFNSFAMLIFPVLFFISYSLFFAISLYETHGIKSTVYLLRHYLIITLIMPCLNAQMLNFWYPIAYLLKDPGSPIYSVSDQINLLPYIQIKTLATLACITGVFAFTYKVFIKRAKESPQIIFIYLFTFSCLLIPFLMTSAHENHYFLPAVFVLFPYIFLKSKLFRLSAQILLLLHFLNLYGIYGEFPDFISEPLKAAYSLELGLTYSLISIPCYVFMLFCLFKWALNQEKSSPT